jgi:phage gp36-like protein
MSYAVKQDMIDRFTELEVIQLTNEVVEPSTVINDAVLDRALADGDAEIDGYLMGRYTLPLQTVPGMLKSLCCDIARYRLYDDRATDQVTKRYDDAIKLLTRIAKGEVSLGPTGADAAPKGMGGPTVVANDRVFTGDNLKDFTL